MADLTQRVKYTVEVDSSALATLRLEISTGIIALESWEKGMKAAVEASKKAGSAFASVTSKMQANTLASARADLELKDLIKSQNAAGTASVNLANQVAGLNTAFREMKSAGAQAKNAVENVQKASTAAGKAAEGAETATEKSGMTFLRAFGKFQAAKWIITETFQAITKGAQQVDLDKTLGRQITNYSNILKEAQERTEGTVSTAALRKSMALMSSFGIPMTRFADSMELVQKMALRTGQSAEFLTDSFSRGISRLSPLVLDNLGIQVSLKDAFSQYGASVGKATEELSKHEKMTALLNYTLKIMKANTEGVNFTGTSTTLAKAQTSWDNFWSGVQERGALTVYGFDIAFESTRASGLAAYDELQAMKSSAFVDFEQFKLSENATARLQEQLRQNAMILRTIKELGGSAEVKALYAGTSPIFTRRSMVMAGMGDPDNIMAVFKDLGGGRMGQAMDDWSDKFEDWRTASMGALAAVANNLDQGTIPAFRRLSEELAETLAPAQMIELQAEFDKLIQSQTKKISTRAMELAKAAAEAHGGDVNSWYFQYLLRLSQEDGMLLGIIAKMRIKGEEMRKNSAIAEAGNQKNEAALKLMLDELAYTDLMRDLEEGRTLVQAKLNEAKTEENKIEHEISKAHEALTEAQRSGAGLAQAEALKRLATVRTEADIRRSSWQEALDSQNAYFKEFQDGTEAQRDAEVGRLQVIIDQLKAFAAQAQLMRLMATFGTGGFKMFGAAAGVDAEGIDIQIAEMKALADRLGKLKFRGGRNEADKEANLEGTTKHLDFDQEHDRQQEEYARRMKPFMDMRRDAQQAMIELSKPIADVTGVNPLSTGEYAKLKETYDKFKELEKGARAIGLDLQLDPGILSMVNAEFAEMSGHFEKIANMADGMHRFADGLQSAFAGMEGLVGGEYVAMMGDLVQGFEGLSQAIGENANAYGMMNAVAPIMRAFTHNLIKDRKAQAGIEMLMQGAAAWAAAATGNIPAAVAHGISAAMYGGIAGGLIKLPKGKASEDKPGADRNGKAAPRPDIHIYISGPIATTEAERGLMIRDALQAASRQGL